MKYENYKPESRKVKSLVEEAIQETLNELDIEMSGLKLEFIMSRLSQRSSFGPYLNREVVKPEKPDAVIKRQKYTERLNRLKSENIDLIQTDDFRVFREVCTSLQLDVRLIRTGYRETAYADARKMIAYIFNRYFRYGVTKTGVLMNKDHSTVIHAVRKHEQFMQIDKQYARRFYNVMTTIKENLSDILELTPSQEKEYLKVLKQ
jgi:chromosomal replication initiation ATPase DnaA